MAAGRRSEAGNDDAFVPQSGACCASPVRSPSAPRRDVVSPPARFCEPPPRSQAICVGAPHRTGRERAISCDRRPTVRMAPRAIRRRRSSSTACGFESLPCRVQDMDCRWDRRRRRRVLRIRMGVGFGLDLGKPSPDATRRRPPGNEPGLAGIAPAGTGEASSELLDGHPVVRERNVRAGLRTVFAGRRLVVISRRFRFGHGRRTLTRGDRFPVRRSLGRPLSELSSTASPHAKCHRASR